MQTTNTLSRDDTMFGICEALGEDFRFNPTYLRIVLSVALLWSPVAVIGTYFALGVVVAASRLISPNPRVAEAAEEGERALVEAHAPLHGDNEAEAMAVAA